METTFEERTITLSEEEIFALLHLPSFRAANQLSPFYSLQAEGRAVEIDPLEGLRRLASKDLWDMKKEELTLEGRLFFVPLFNSTSRVMLFRGATETTPAQEFYLYKKYIVQYSDLGGMTVFGPMREQDLVEHFRRIFADRRSPVSDNRLSLLEDEYIALSLVYRLQAERGGEPVRGEDVSRVAADKLAAGELALPIIGRAGDGILSLLESDPAALQQALQGLAADGLIEQPIRGGFGMAQLTRQLFQKILDEVELFMLREEFREEELLAREVSIFAGDQGYFLGRCSYSDQFQRRIVHIEDLEWHALFRVINEIARPADYLARLTLDVVRRQKAFLRG